MTTDVLPSRAPRSRIAPDAIADLSLRKLLSFRAVAANGSFHLAADQLDYTQSAVSQHIAALEASLGVRLFDRSRGRRTVVLTEAGRLLLRHADAITDRVAAARADLVAYAAGTTGTLRVGVYQSAGARILPATMMRFTRAWPGVEVLLTENATDTALLELVEPGALDLAFGVLPVPEGPFDGVELLRDPYVLIVPADSPLATTRPFPPASTIAAQPLIGFSASRAADDAEAFLRRSGTDPHFVFHSMDNTTVQAMVRSGLGVALVPILTVDAADPTVVVIPTDLPPRRVALMWHRDRHRMPAALAFVDAAVEVCRALQRELDSVTDRAGPGR